MMQLLIHLVKQLYRIIASLVNGVQDKRTPMLDCNIAPTLIAMRGNPPAATAEKQAELIARWQNEIFVSCQQHPKIKVSIFTEPVHHTVHHGPPLHSKSKIWAVK